MDEYDVIYLDDDERNARATVVDRRKGGGSGRVVVGGSRPSRSSVVVPPSRRPTVIHSGGGRPRAQQVVIQEEPEKRKLLGDLTTGEVVEIAAQILAAIQPLPGAPTAAGEVETDVENLVIYQTALATHAKRDEQLRTLGGLLGKILK
jgi:hypothetical protein